MVDCSLLWLGNSVTPRGMALKQGARGESTGDDLHEMRAPASNNEQAEGGEHPLERHITAPFITRYASVAEMAT
jgi:hypothetical protein